MDDEYYLRRMSDILQDGCQPRPRFPSNPTRLSRHVILGNQQNAEDLDHLWQLKVTHVLCCSFTRRSFYSPYPPALNLAYKCLPTEDREDFNIAAYFPEAFHFVKSAKEDGRALVHCNMGVNRSAAIVAAYLMIDERRLLLNTIAYLKYKRQLVLTNRGFRRQLVRFARDNNLLDPFPTDIPRSVRRVRVEGGLEGSTSAAWMMRRVERVSKKGDPLLYGAATEDERGSKFEKLGLSNRNIRPRCSYKETFSTLVNNNEDKDNLVAKATEQPGRRKTTDTFTLQLIPLVPYKRSPPRSHEITIEYFRAADGDRMTRSHIATSRTRTDRHRSKDGAASDSELVNRHYSPPPPLKPPLVALGTRRTTAVLTQNSRTDSKQAAVGADFDDGVKSMPSFSRLKISADQGGWISCDDRRSNS